MRTTSQEHIRTVQHVWVITTFRYSVGNVNQPVYVIEPTTRQRIHIQDGLLRVVFHHRRMLLYRLSSYSRGHRLYFRLFSPHIYINAR